MKAFAAVPALLAPTVAVVAGDLLHRSRHIAGFDRLHAIGYAASIAVSILLWAPLVRATSVGRPRLRLFSAALFVGLFTLSAGVQSATYALHFTYYSFDSAQYVDSLPWIVLGTLPPRPIVFVHVALALVIAVAIVALARRTAAPVDTTTIRRRRALLFLPVLVLPVAAKIPTSYAGYQSTSPELIYFHGVSWAFIDRAYRASSGAVRLSRVQRRTPPSLPPIPRTPSRPRNVLFILQEALRADMTCSAYDPACPEANRESNDLLPHRIPLERLRANGSSTVVAFSSIFSGVDPTDTRARLQSAPLVWELAHAAGYDTAFWTNQHPMFGNYRFYWQDLPLSQGCAGAELDPLADVLAGPSDELVADRAIHDWDALREPFFAVVQLSNIHFPRVFDPERAPFQPTDPFEKEEPYRNHYRNVAYLSDLAVARLVAHVRASKSGERTVIVMSSDHGEALEEHANENFHSSSAHEEEIRVPGWVDAPPGTLSPEEEAELRARRYEPVFQLDLGPTFLDLLGVWDAPAVAPFREAMPGRPLTRGERARGPHTITNVSWIWEYWKPNWGLMDWPMKVLAGPTDHAYQCFDLSRDPGEIHDLGEGACVSLAAAARERFGIMPADIEKDLRRAPGWGRGGGR